MRRGLLVGSLAALLLAAVGSAASEKSPRVSAHRSALDARRRADPGHRRPGRAGSAALARRADCDARTPARGGVGSKMASRPVPAPSCLPRSSPLAPGRTDRPEARPARHRRGPVAIRPPFVPVAPTEAVLEPNGLILVAESGQSRLARIDPTTGRDTLVRRIVQPFGLVPTPSGVLYSTSESRGRPGRERRLDDNARRRGRGCRPLALDSSGNLYFSTVSQSSVSKAARAR